MSQTAGRRAKEKKRCATQPPRATPADAPLPYTDVSAWRQATGRRTMTSIHTHIAILLDRSGSMELLRDDIIGGFNAFVAQQRAVPGEATLTLVQFDSQQPYEVLHRFAPLAEVQLLTRDSYVPRAATPLLDAMGQAIIDLQHDLGAIPTARRPAHVIVVIITDGRENASIEFSKGQVARLVAQTQAAGWEYVFLSADMGAIDDALAVGVRAEASLAFRRDATGTMLAYQSLSDNIAAQRAGRRRDLSFSDEDRAQQR